MKKQLKIKFTSNYTPRKAGEVAELDKRLADFYIGAGVAKIYEDCDDCDDNEPCKDCDEKAKQAASDQPKSSRKKGKISNESFKNE